MRSVSLEVRQSYFLMAWSSLESAHSSLDVWIGFSSVEGAEEGLDPQGEAFNLESCQNWLPGEPHPATAEHCVRLGPAGQCNTDLCSAPHSYVCELRPGGMDCWVALLPPFPLFIFSGPVLAKCLLNVCSCAWVGAEPEEIKTEATRWGGRWFCQVTQP